MSPTSAPQSQSVAWQKHGTLRCTLLISPHNINEMWWSIEFLCFYFSPLCSLLQATLPGTYNLLEESFIIISMKKWNQQTAKILLTIFMFVFLRVQQKCNRDLPQSHRWNMYSTQVSGEWSHMSAHINFFIGKINRRCSVILTHACTCIHTNMCGHPTVHAHADWGVALRERPIWLLVQV